MQHRVSGRVAVTEKPDVVWDRPDLDRLYARLKDEYELRERTKTLTRKLAVIADTAEVLTDIIDTRRSLRLKIVIVVLIAVELLVAGYRPAIRRCIRIHSDQDGPYISCVACLFRKTGFHPSGHGPRACFSETCSRAFG